MINFKYVTKAIKDYTYIIKIQGIDNSIYSREYEESNLLMEQTIYEIGKEIESEKVNKSCDITASNALVRVLNDLIDEITKHKAENMSKKTFYVIFPYVDNIVTINWCIQTYIKAHILGFYTKEDKDNLKAYRDNRKKILMNIEVAKKCLQKDNANAN